MEFSAKTSNVELSDHLLSIANYYSESDDIWRQNVYKKASDIISKLPYKVTSAEQIKNIKGIGKSIYKDVDEFLKHSTSKRYSEILEISPASLARENMIKMMLKIHGFDVATAAKLYDLGYTTLEKIKKYDKLTLAQKIGIKYQNDFNVRIFRKEMDIIKKELIKLIPSSFKWELTGSYRRGKESSGDVDILVSSTTKSGLSLNMEDVLMHLNDIIIDDITPNATKKYMGVMRLNIDSVAHRIDVTLIDDRSWISALLHSTGDSDFNILMSKRASDLGLKLSVYGLFDDNKKIYYVLNSERDVFNMLGVKYYPPEERSNVSELELL